MKASDLLTGRRRFLPDSGIIDVIKTSKKYDDDLQSHTARTLLIFETSNQHTWLVMTVKRLYVVLDDVRRPEAKVQWSTGRIPPNVITSERLEPSIRTGIVRINERERGWLFTKSLFSNITLEENIKIMNDDMLENPNQ